MVEWWSLKAGLAGLRWNDGLAMWNLAGWQWNGGPKGEVNSFPFLGIKVCWLNWGLVWKLSRCRNSSRSHCCNPEDFYWRYEVCMCLFKGVSVCTGVCGSGFVWQCVGWVLTVVFFVYFLGVRRGHPHSHSLLVSNRSSVPMGDSCTWCLHWPWLCRVVEREWRAKQEVAVCELQSQTKSCKEKRLKRF